jgi:hypothetical protein
MGPPPRGLAAEANDCFMVRLLLGPTEYKVAARFLARKAGPLGSSSTSPRSTQCMEVRGPCRCDHLHRRVVLRVPPASTPRLPAA